MPELEKTTETTSWVVKMSEALTSMIDTMERTLGTFISSSDSSTHGDVGFTYDDAYKPDPDESYAPLSLDSTQKGYTLVEGESDDFSHDNIYRKNEDFEIVDNSDSSDEIINNIKKDGVKNTMQARKNNASISSISESTESNSQDSEDKRMSNS